MDPEQQAVSPRPWVNVCCVSCLLVVAAVFFGGYFLLSAVGGPVSQSLSALPANYPKDLPLYRVEQADSISAMQGKQKSRVLQLILAPVKLLAGLGGNATVSTSVNGSASSTSVEDVKNMLSVYAAQIEHEDSVTVTWRGLNAPRADVIAYYEKLFKSAGLAEQSAHDDVTATDLLFAARPDEAVQIQLTDRADVPGIDQLVITVSYSAK